MPVRPLTAAFAVLCAVGFGAPRPAAAQLRVSSPYLDIVSRYQQGDQQKAVAELGSVPIAGLRERTRKELRDLTCQVLCGTSDCRKARADKPQEFQQVIEAWS